MMKKAEIAMILFIATILLMSTVSFPITKKERKEHFSKANLYYANAEYKKAYDEYKKLVLNGVKNQIIYYNLGNCAFRLHRLGEAVLWYKRALWIDPGYERAEKNLIYVQSFLKDKIRPSKKTFLEKIWLSILGVFSLNTALLLLLLFFVVGCVEMVLFFRKRGTVGYKKWRIALVSIWIMIILWGGIFFAMLWRVNTTKEAVILASKADVRSGPSKENPVLFTVHEGLIVDIGEDTVQWVQIVLPNGWNGWVEKRIVGKVQNF